MENGRIGHLPVLSMATVGSFFLMWAAMHDLVRGADDALLLEYLALAVGASGFICLYRAGPRVLTQREQRMWFAGTGCLLALFDLGAASAVLRPKYPLDPVIGAAFLAVGLPLLGSIGYHLFRRQPGQ